MGILDSLVKHLGIIKHQLLAFAITGAIIIFFFAKDLAAATDKDVVREGIHMYYSAIALLFLGGAFYVFAYLRLPSSEQEGVFEREGVETVRRHQRKSRALRESKPDVR